jgi:class 3 adenylate cyclase
VPKVRACQQTRRKILRDCGAPLQAAPSPITAPEASAVVDDSTQPTIAANATPEGGRKTVTALFADIKGSTELMAELDPEEVMGIAAI